MQSIITVLTTLVGDPQGIISVEFGQIPISGLREDVVWSFPYICECNIVISGMGHFESMAFIWTTLVKDH